MIGSFFALVGAGSTLFAGAPWGLDRLTLFASVFLFAFFPAVLGAADTISSSEGTRVFQFLGANRRTMTAAVAVNLLKAGLSGVASGVIVVFVAILLLADLSVGASVVRSAPNLPTLIYLFGVCALGITAGAATGVVLSWKDSSY